MKKTEGKVDGEKKAKKTKDGKKEKDGADKKVKKTKKKQKRSNEEEKAILEKLKEDIAADAEFGINSQTMIDLQTFFREKFVELKEDDTGDDDIADNLYSKLKGLKLEKSKVEKYGHIIFNTVFGINIGKEVATNSAVLEAFFARAHRSKFQSFEVLMCLEYFLLKKYPDTDYTKYIATIAMHFCKADILSKEFMLKWKRGELDEILVQSCLYCKESDDKFKEYCTDFLAYLENDDDEEDSDDDDEDEEEEEGQEQATEKQNE